MIIPIVCRILKCLAASGVQVFVASHDYLLTHELSLAVEYPEMAADCAPWPIRFFGFTRQREDGFVTCEPGNILADLENNSILYEFAALYDRRRKLFDAKPQPSHP